MLLLPYLPLLHLCMLLPQENSFFHEASRVHPQQGPSCPASRGGNYLIISCSLLLLSLDRRYVALNFFFLFKKTIAALYSSALNYVFFLTKIYIIIFCRFQMSYYLKLCRKKSYFLEEKKTIQYNLKIKSLLCLTV